MQTVVVLLQALKAQETAIEAVTIIGVLAFEIEMSFVFL